MISHMWNGFILIAHTEAWVSLFLTCFSTCTATWRLVQDDTHLHLSNARWGQCDCCQSAECSLEVLWVTEREHYYSWRGSDCEHVRIIMQELSRKSNFTCSLASTAASGGEKQLLRPTPSASYRRSQGPEMILTNAHTNTHHWPLTLKRAQAHSQQTVHSRELMGR